MDTIGSKLQARRGIAPGFDFLRIFLASGVVAWHVPAIVKGDVSWGSTPIVWLLGYSILAAFFSLSGFLIAGSAQRLTLGNFLINRGLRIVPALLVEVVLCTLLLGPIFTNISLYEYFTSPQTWHYFTNIIGIINYTLPGVFTQNPTDIVNNTLWTVPHEIMCYAAISILVIIGLLKRPMIIVALTAIMTISGIFLELYGLTKTSHGVVGKFVYIVFVSNASRLYSGFLFGISAYLLRNRIVYSWRIFSICILLCAVISFFPIGSVPLATTLVLPEILYITIFIGVTDVPIPSIFRKGDYSYGIYLYGWPIQQLTVSTFPAVSSLLLQFLISIPLITAFAAFSWHFIERPILELRKKFSFVARVRLDETKSGHEAPAVEKLAANTSKS